MIINDRNAADIIARGNADHTRIRTLLAQGSLEANQRAMRLLEGRIDADMTDAIHTSPERDDDRAIAARILNDLPGPTLQHRLGRAKYDALMRLRNNL